MTADSASSPSSRVGCDTPRVAHGRHEAQVSGPDPRQRQAGRRLFRRRSGLLQHRRDLLRPDLVELVDDAQRPDHVGQPDREVEALGDLPVVHLDDELAHREPAEHVRHDERHLGLEVRGQRTGVHDVDVGLGELAVPPLLRPLPPPRLLDLVAPERERQPARVLHDVPRERHGEVEVQPPARRRHRPATRPAATRRRSPCRRPRPAHSRSTGSRTRLDRGEPVQLERLPDHVEEPLLHDAVRGQVLGNPLIGVTRPVGALTPSILANRGSCPAPARSSSRGRDRAGPACRRPSAGPRPATSASSPRRSRRPGRSARSNRRTGRRRSGRSRTARTTASCDGRSGTMNITEPSVCPGAWATSTSGPRGGGPHPRPGRRRGRLGPGGPPSELLLEHGQQPVVHRGEGVREAVPVVPVDVGGRLAAVSPPQTGVTAYTWSRCPWVSRTAAGRSPFSRHTSARRSSTPMPGSTTRHSSPGPVART